MIRHDPTEPLTEEVTVGEASVSRAIVDMFGSPPVILEGTQEELNLHGFLRIEDWLVALLLVGIRHAMPNLSNEEAAAVGTIFASNLRLGNSYPLWRKQFGEVERYGLSNLMIRIISELNRGLHQL